MDLDGLQRRATADGRACVVGAVIVNERAEVFLQKRAPHVRHFPGCWDIVGGHVEPGEDLRTALAREVLEETGWQLDAVLGLVHVVDWTARDGVPKREIDVLATVSGDLGRPRIEADKFTGFGWFGEAGLLELATDGDSAMVDVALRALSARAR
ncbi:MAG TPA: NUDIX domain-containing protein [Actinokineospora sp.]|jgi:8-oxo-dGTP pyrophosphatase MutT (NUDIX family)|nr:NUDIX domain-containing protein [Actinokineospora sp.]